MGGDRDGNPNVTPMVTYEVSLTQRLQAATLLMRDMNTLYSELAICKGFSPEMVALADEVRQSKDMREKYRRVIGFLTRRLSATIKWCEIELENCAKKGDNTCFLFLLPRSLSSHMSTYLHILTHLYYILHTTNTLQVLLLRT